MARKFLWFTVVVVVSFLVSYLGTGTGDRHVSRGVELYKQGKFSEAEKELRIGFDKEIKRYPREQVLTILGNIYNQQKQLDKAIKFHKKALAINPLFYEAWVNLGIIYRLKNDFNKAEDCYLEAMKLKPDYAQLYASLGALYIHREEFSKAIIYLKKAVKLDPELAVSHANISMAYALDGQIEKARKSLRIAEKYGYTNTVLLKQTLDRLKSNDSGF